MNLLKEWRKYLDYLKKYMKFILTVYIVAEIIIFLKIGQTNKLMFASSFFVVLFILCTIFLSFYDSETSILIYLFSIPLLPLVLYLLARLNLKWIGSTIYWIYFAIFIINIFRFREDYNFSLKFLRMKHKFSLLVYSLIIILAAISVMLSINILESANLVGLSIISTIALSLILLSYKKFDEDFLIKTITYISLSVALSSIPDIIVTIYNLIFRGNNQHLYGVLGSNFMLGYTLMILPFILLFAVNEDFSCKYKDVYKGLLILETINLCTQKSRGIALAVALCFLLIILYDRKNYKKYLLISLVVFVCLGYNITHRWEFNEIKSEIEINGLEGVITNSQGLMRQMLEQFKSRRPIWVVAIGMIMSYPLFGVGPGQFKNYYLAFGGNPHKMYIDAHNIILNVATEFGLIFTAVLFLSVLAIIIKSIVNMNRDKKSWKILVPAVIGFVCLIVYGNITGFAFMTSSYPISYVPAFVFMFVITLMEKIISITERK